MLLDHRLMKEERCSFSDRIMANFMSLSASLVVCFVTFNSFDICLSVYFKPFQFLTEGASQQTLICLVAIKSLCVVLFKLLLFCDKAVLDLFSKDGQCDF